MTSVLYQEREISSEAANRISVHLTSIESILATEQKRLQEACDREGEEHAIFPGLPAEMRWRVMVLGSSVEDMNFWIRREDEDGGQWYKLTEIETGYEVGAVEASEACERYFRHLG